MGNTQRTYNGGFTAIEIALVILILGLLLAGMFSRSQPVSRESREQETRNKMDRITSAIASFVRKNGRIPCAGQYETGALIPVGAEFGHTVGEPCAGNRAAEGIVPYRTLGLPPGMARDGWGHYFTYRVSPNAANANPPVIPLGDSVHEKCLTAAWFDDPVMPTKHVNPEKARFCCSPHESGAYRFPPSTDIVIVDQTGAVISPQRTANVSRYHDLDPADNPPGTFPIASPGTDIEMVAYVLVSHGANGAGAIMPENMSLRRTSLVNAGANEVLNADGVSMDLVTIAPFDVTFVDAPRNDNPNAGTGYFDDIVLWKTQFDVYEDGGRESCATP